LASRERVERGEGGWAGRREIVTLEATARHAVRAAQDIHG
jgi:hypothetical protein